MPRSSGTPAGALRPCGTVAMPPLLVAQAHTAGRAANCLATQHGWWALPARCPPVCAGRCPPCTVCAGVGAGCGPPTGVMHAVRRPCPCVALPARAVPLRCARRRCWTTRTHRTCCCPWWPQPTRSTSWGRASTACTSSLTRTGGGWGWGQGRLGCVPRVMGWLGVVGRIVQARGHQGHGRHCRHSQSSRCSCLPCVQGARRIREPAGAARAVVRLQGSVHVV